MFVVGMTTFTKMAITLEWIFSPNLVHVHELNMRLHEKCLGTWWHYNRKKKMKLALTTQLLVRLSWKLACSVFVQGAIIAYEDIEITLKTCLPSVNWHSAAIRQLLKEANWNETRCACLTHGPKSLRNFKEMCVNDGILCNILQILYTVYSNHVNLLILNNFASKSTAVNQTLCWIFEILKLVLSV